ncbi:hypothetical protein DFH09DRAFT_1335712 [Mycena vulgaris]|nr:hypothetical protein DFH09DRAFT_1335712 [Mycena vulgaris]
MASASTDGATNTGNVSGLTGQFLSARSTEVVSTDGASPANPPTIRSPVHARGKVHRDEFGVNYLLDPITSNHYDVFDDETVPDLPPRGSPLRNTSETSSEASDLTSARTSLEPAGSSAEELLSALVSDIQSSPLTAEQQSRFTSLRGLLSNFRAATTSLREFRDEVATCIDSLSDGVVAATIHLEETVESNVRVLRAIGATEEQLAQLLAAVADSNSRPACAVSLHPGKKHPEVAVTDLGDLREPMDRALAPRGPRESAHDFQRRGLGTVERKTRNMDSFAPAEFRSGGTANTQRQARFAGTGSVSTAGQRLPYGSSARSRDEPPHLAPMGVNQSISGVLTPQHPAEHNPETTFEVFAAEKDDQICLMVDRHVGRAMVAPPRVPKIENPPLFRGEDDDDIFMPWLGKLCTWLQGYGLGGPQYEDHHIMYLKTALDGHALEWFNTEVEPLDRESTILFEFDTILCALHRRFVTSATAQRATHDYDVVKYNPARGVEHLIGELIRTSNKMREPHTPFTIRKRFMAEIPVSVHNELIRRGLFPEYTNLEMLKNHAQTWIEAQALMRWTSVGPAPSARPNSTPARSSAPARAGPIRPLQSRAVSVATRGPTAAVRTATSSDQRSHGPIITPATTPKSTKTCFGCGIVGHIASDPICAQYNESASSRPRIGAQRVMESYMDKGDEETPYEGEADAGIPTDLAEGLWGGSQYQADELLDDPNVLEEYEGDPHAAPDLEEILDGADTGKIHVGAVCQYYSLCVIPDEERTEDDENEAVLVDLASAHDRNRYTRLDIHNYQLDLMDESFTLWDTAEEDRMRGRQSPLIAPAPSYRTLLGKFEAAPPTSLSSVHASIE